MNRAMKRFLKTGWADCKLTKRWRYPKQYNFIGIKTYKTGSDTAYSSITDIKQKVVFDATDSRLEWLQNIMVRRSGKWHSHIGFYRPAKRFFDIITKDLDINRPVYVKGHSRGGSIGVLFCALLKEAGYDVSMTSYGAPKTGGGEHLKELEKLGFECIRVEVKGDPVCSLPRSTFRKWEHYSTEEVVLKYNYIGGSFVRNYVKHGMYGDAIEGTIVSNC